MPQEKKRSIRYRSFLSCDNPKGVVECGAVRKSKTSSSQKNEYHTHKIETPSFAFTKEDKKEMGVVRGFTRELATSPSFQLQELPKGANNTRNHVTSSWVHNGHKDDFAKDLLKGVLDLQESLVILSKLQESSSYMSKRKQKHKQKDEEGGWFGGMGNGLMDSNRLGYLLDEERLDMGLERPRVSSDGSSRKLFDEVKNVVRESLLRHNVTRNPSFGNFPYRKKSSSHSVPYTSSSSFGLFDSSISSTASQRKKGKGSNLIFKLMGLESLPPSPRNYRKGEKVLNLTKPMYDIESPRARKSQLAPRELGAKQRAFDEILESLNFKGLLRTNSAKGLTPNLRNFEDFPSVDDGPPIVVMRPLRFWGDGVPGNEDNLVKPRSRRGSPQEAVRHSEAANFRDKFRELTARESFEGERLSPKKTGGRRVSEGYQKVTLTGGNGGGMRDTQKANELGSRDLGKLTRTQMKKKNDEDFISKNQISAQEKIFSTTISEYGIAKTSESSRQQKKSRQPVSMMHVESQRRKGGMMGSESPYTEEIDSSSENEYVCPTFDSMIISNLNIQRWNECSRAMTAGYNADSQSSVSDTRDDIQYLNNDLRNCRHVSLMGMPELADGHHPDDNQSLLSEITSTSISEHCSLSGGDLDESQSPLSEVTSITTHEIGITGHLATNEEENADHSRNYEPCGECIEEETDYESATKCLTPRAKLKAFLLSSPSFVTRAEELFDVQVNPGLTRHITDESDLDFASSRVLLDCAVEHLEIRSSQLSQVCVLPLSTTCPRETPSLSQLLEEICNEVEDLRCYLNPTSKGFSSDHLYALLDRDLRSKSRVWEIGWRNAFSVDEVEQLICEVDVFVLGNLIEEVLADFSL